MYNQDYMKWASLNQNFTGPMFDMQKLVMPVAERISRENVSLWTDSMSSFVKYMQGTNKINRSEDFLKAHFHFMEEQGSKNLQYVQNILKICEESLSEYCELMGEKLGSIFTAEGSKPASSSHKKHGD